MINDRDRQQVDLLLTVLGYLDWEGCFALWGGAAINLFYEEMPRLSMDIDLFYLPDHSTETYILEMMKFLEQYKKIFNQYNFQAKIVSREFPDINFARKWIKAIRRNLGENLDPLPCLYVSDRSVSVRVELCYYKRMALLPTQLKALSPGVCRTFQKELQVRCLDQKELMAAKIVTMLEKQQSQDIFDSWFFLRQGYSLVNMMDLLVVYIVRGHKPFSAILDPEFLPFKMNGLDRTVKEKININELAAFRKKIVPEIRACLDERHKKFLISFMQGDPQWQLIPFEHLKDLPDIKRKIHLFKHMPIFKREDEISKLKSI